MYKKRKVIAIIGAAGSGRRMAASLPKQFIKLNGKTILATTVEKFEKCKLIDEIIVVSSKDYVELCGKILVECKNLKIIKGGNERQDSIGNAINYLCETGEDEKTIVLIHDGVRPFVNEEIIKRVISATYEKGAAIAAVKTKDTIRHIDEGTLDRSKLFNVQTPQGFYYSIIKKAHEQAKLDGFYGTDDASLVERLGINIDIVNGNESNKKITTPEDLIMENRIGTGFDVHQLVFGRKLVLGGVEIQYEKGLLGHSDADVLLHSLMDALLGAAALGDIGKLFPDNDEKYKGISSMDLLKQVKTLLNQAGFCLQNADMTIICQQPKLCGYIDMMRKNISTALDVNIDRISIKATTTEKLGYTGRGEGIASEAVCLLNNNN